jgi:hypothetical protein
MPLNENSDLFTRALLRVPVPWVFVLTYLVGVGLEKLIFRHAHLTDSVFVTVTGAIVFALGAALAAWGWGSRVENRRSGVSLPVSNDWAFATSPLPFMDRGVPSQMVGTTALAQ